MSERLNLPPLVLVIEDDHLASLFYAGSLEKVGLQVICADSTEKAVHLAELHGHRIVLMLVDVVLAPPEYRLTGDLRNRVQNGARLLSLLSYHCPKAIAVQMSAYSLKELLENGYKVEAHHFLQKPVKPGLLRETVQKLLPDLKVPSRPILPHSDVTWCG